MRPAAYLAAGSVEGGEHWRHFALNIPYYTHFTSPIRR
jgi:exoribonuclease R